MSLIRSRGSRRSDSAPTDTTAASLTFVLLSWHVRTTPNAKDWFTRAKVVCSDLGRE